VVEAIMIFHISAVITGGIISGSSIRARIAARPGMRACRNSATPSPSPTWIVTATRVKLSVKPKARTNSGSSTRPR
jgi:hypothetical protein